MNNRRGMHPNFFFGNLTQFLYLHTLSGLWKRNKSHAKVGGYFFRKNVGVSYHNHDDDHHAIFGGHALPSVHNGASDFMNCFLFFYNYSILRNCYASDLHLIESYEI